MIPRLNTELRQLQDQQKGLQELKPKIDEVKEGGREGGRAGGRASERASERVRGRGDNNKAERRKK